MVSTFITENRGLEDRLSSLCSIQEKTIAKMLEPSLNIPENIKTLLHLEMERRLIYKKSNFNRSGSLRDSSAENKMKFDYKSVLENFHRYPDAVMKYARGFDKNENEVRLISESAVTALNELKLKKYDVDNNVEHMENELLESEVLSEDSDEDYDDIENTKKRKLSKVTKSQRKRSKISKHRNSLKIQSIKYSYDVDLYEKESMKLTKHFIIKHSLQGLLSKLCSLPNEDLDEMYLKNHIPVRLKRLLCLEHYRRECFLETFKYSGVVPSNDRMFFPYKAMLFKEISFKTAVRKFIMNYTSKRDCLKYMTSTKYAVSKDPISMKRKMRELKLLKKKRIVDNKSAWNDEKMTEGEISENQEKEFSEIQELEMSEIQDEEMSKIRKGEIVNNKYFIHPKESIKRVKDTKENGYKNFYYNLITKEFGAKYEILLDALCNHVINYVITLHDIDNIDGKDLLLKQLSIAQNQLYHFMDKIEEYLKDIVNKSTTDFPYENMLKNLWKDIFEEEIDDIDDIDQDKIDDFSKTLRMILENDLISYVFIILMENV